MRVIVSTECQDKGARAVIGCRACAGSFWWKDTLVESTHPSYASRGRIQTDYAGAIEVRSDAILVGGKNTA